MLDHLKLHDNNTLENMTLCEEYSAGVKKFSLNFGNIPIVRL